MQRAASYPSVPEQPRTLAIAGSLLLVSLSYLLLLAAPAISRHFGAMALGNGGLKALESWLPLACGAGLVLGGASALVFVLTQITREAQRRPYVSLAPVLAAFAACVLIGLRAELPLPGVSAEHVAVFAVAVAVVGGSLVQTPRMSAQLLGMACTFLPPASLFGVLWVLSGSSDPARAIWGLPASTRAFLGMLTLSSFAIGAVATLGRRAEPSSEPVLFGSRAEPRASMTARLPVERVYASRDAARELEQSLLEDEALLTRRGFPGWLIAVLGAAAVVLSFMAVKLYMERRAATEFLEGRAAPSALQPAAQPEVAATLVEPVAPAPEPVAPALAAPEPAPPPSDVRSEAPVQALPSTTLEADTELRSSHNPGRARASHRAVRAAKAKTPVEKAQKPAPEARLESKPAAPLAKAKPERAEDSASLALKAARAATKEEPKPAAEPKLAAPTTPTSRGDESLDELMDNVMKPTKGAKKRDVSEDPIFGL